MGSNASSGLFTSVRQQFEALPPRSRKMLAFLLILLGVVWSVGLWWWTSNSLTLQAEELARQQRTLQNLQTLQVQYVQANQLIEQAEQRLGEIGRQNPSSFIEQRAQEHEVRDALRGIEKGATETRGNIRETRYRVLLERAPLDRTLQFMFDIETSGFLSSESAAIRTNFVQGERLLSLTLDIVAYELVKEE